MWSRHPRYWGGYIFSSWGEDKDEDEAGVAHWGLTR